MPHLTTEETAFLAECYIQNRIGQVSPELLDHLFHCDECQATLYQLIDVIRLKPACAETVYPDIPVISMPPKTRKFGWQVIVTAAASLLLILGLGTLLYMILQPGEKEFSSQLTPEKILPPTESQKDTIVILQQFAQNTKVQNTKPGRKPASSDQSYKEVPYLEELVGDAFRSESIQVLLPSIQQKKNMDFAFKWSTDVDSITLKIMDNSQNTINSIVCSGTGFEFENKLKPGLYYWMLIQDSNIVHVGKIIIR